MHTKKTNLFRELLFAALTAVAVFIVFLPSLKNGFVNWDDPCYILNNLNLKSFDLQWIFTGLSCSNWHPLTTLTFVIDYHIWGLDPWGYHLENTILHAINTFLLFILAMELAYIGYQSYSGGLDEGMRNRSLIIGSVAATLFGLHPIHVESVAWISERKDVLYALFYLLTLLAYLKYAKQRRAAFYFISLLSFALSLLSKPMAVSLPLVLIIIEWYMGKFSGGKGAIKGLAVKMAPFFFLAALSSFITLQAQKTSITSGETLGLSLRILSAFRAYMFYLYKMILPDWLAPVYPHLVQINIINLEYWGSIALFVLITAITVLACRRHRMFLAAWLYFLITLVPVIGLVQVGIQAAADRYAYLPSISIFMIAGYGVIFISERIWRSKYFFCAAVFTIAIAVALISLTLTQEKIWKDSIALWNHEIEYLKNIETRGRAGNAESMKLAYTLSYYNRAMAYQDKGDFDSAILDYSRVVEVNPEYTAAYINKGILFGRLGNFNAAIENFNKAIAMDPSDTEAYYNRGIAYKQLNYNDLAQKDFQTAAGLQGRGGF